MKLVGISGAIIGTKTAIVVNKVLEEVKKLDPEIETELLDMKEYDVQFCDGRDPSAYTGDTKKVIDSVISSDFCLIGTPIYQASMSGVLKNLFDLIPPSALQQKVIGFVATGGDLPALSRDRKSAQADRRLFPVLCGPGLCICA